MRRPAIRLLRAAAVSLAAMALGPVANAIAAPPHVTITNPLNGSVSNDQTPFFSGLAEVGSGELTLRLYDGPTAEGTPIQELSTLLLALGGGWSLGPAEPLKDGTYTAQATQTNPALETGRSSPVTFTVDTAAPTVTLNSPNPPSYNTTPSFTGTASDTTPVTVQIHAGVTAKGAVVSIAVATGTGAGWTSGNANPALSIGTYTAVATQPSSLLGNPVGRSGPVTFTITPPPLIPPAVVPSPAPPVVSVTNVVVPSAPLMQPFPAVRLVGTDTASGVKLRLLRVQQTPAGALITVRCRGRGCPIKSARRVALPNKRRVAPIDFRSFERPLRFGITLEILISKRGEIGKYTRFAIRRGKLPERVDTCLDSTGVKPLACPSS
jgi:hypothetical protein